MVARSALSSGMQSIAEVAAKLGLSHRRRLVQL
jgi:hypothetical protein